jgi:hypothetical protein
MLGRDLLVEFDAGIEAARQRRVLDQMRLRSMTIFRRAEAAVG